MTRPASAEMIRSDPILRLYGELKHGGTRALTYYSSLLADLIGVPQSGMLVLGPPYIEVPSAGALLAGAVAKRLIETEPTTRYEELRRRPQEDSADYAYLGRDERIAAQSRIAATVHMPSGLDSADVVVVNDCCVTGAQEEALGAALARAGVQSVLFVYIADCSEAATDKPQVEGELNARGIASDGELRDYLREGHFVFTARLVRRLLSGTEECFVTRLSVLSDAHRRTLSELCSAEGLGASRAFSSRVTYLTISSDYQSSNVPSIDRNA